MTESLTRDLGGELRDIVDDCIDRYREAGGAMATLEDERVRVSLARVWGASEFVAASCIRDPDLLERLVKNHMLDSTGVSELDVGTHDSLPEKDFLNLIRRWRRQEMVRLAWRDLAGWASIDETLRGQSDLADCAIRCALAYQKDQHPARAGEKPTGTPPLIILGMGKLGGCELNFSSDIDLVFLYSGNGKPDSETRYTRLGQRLIQSLDAVTEEGFVFRVDMRLRPFGESGPLLMSVTAFENYLQEHGREWERYAYIKARPISMPEVCRDLFSGVLQPFVYRRYLDYGVFESLRKMKALIEHEVARRDLRDNIKLGPGGIREIEFIAQSFQLIRGGRDKDLQDHRLLPVIDRLRKRKLLGELQADRLVEAYRYLRTLENRIQSMHDRQSHDLPANKLDRARLLLAMGDDSWSELVKRLTAHRDLVSSCFADIVFGAPGLGSASDGSPLATLWEQWPPDRSQGVTVLEAAGFDNADAVFDQIDALQNAPLIGRLDETGRRRLDRLAPELLQAAATCTRSHDVLKRLIRIVEIIGTRTAYLALLLENPAVLTRLTQLCALSEFLAQQIAEHPLLLDELIDPRIAEQPPERQQFHDELAARLAQVQAGDGEQGLDALRQFQQAAVFRTAVADLSDAVPLMKVSDRLTDIAELVVDSAVALAWRHLSERHGTPVCGDDAKTRPTGFAVIGYGKLGGIELGYGSDLDLVFVHDSHGSIQATDGPDPVDNAVFFSRLARRVVSILTTQTASGMLYRVDMRLRPSGRSGLLVSSLDAFEAYQKEKAWTWEHQALLRARAVAGNASLCDRFEIIRRDILCHCIRRDSLREDVRNMRERMRAELGTGIEQAFDLKQDPGGLADIEFLVQFWVLRYAGDHPELVIYSDNIRQLEALSATGVVSRDVTDSLRDIYLRYREALHRLSLREEVARVSGTAFAAEQATVGKIWASVMES